MNMNNQIFIAIFLTFVSLQAADTTPLVFNAASSRLSEFVSVIRDLGYSDSFTFELDEHLTSPVEVDLETKILKVSSEFNVRVDLQGKTPLDTLEFACAFGRAQNMNNPFRYVTTRPGITARGVKRLGWGAVIAGALTVVGGTAAFGAGFSPDMDIEQSNNLKKNGALAMGLGLFTAGVMGLRLTDLYGLAFHVTQKGMLDDDAEWFACQSLPTHELTMIHKALNGRTCSFFSDLRLKDRIADKLGREASDSNPV